MYNSMSSAYREIVYSAPTQIMPIFDVIHRNEGTNNDSRHPWLVPLPRSKRYWTTQRYVMRNKAILVKCTEFIPNLLRV